MSSLILFLFGNFATGACLGLAGGCVMLSREIGPAAAALHSAQPGMASAMLLFAIAATVGMAFLVAAFARIAD